MFDYEPRTFWGFLKDVVSSDRERFDEEKWKIKEAAEVSDLEVIFSEFVGFCLFTGWTLLPQFGLAILSLQDSIEPLQYIVIPVGIILGSAHWNSFSEEMWATWAERANYLQEGKKEESMESPFDSI